MRIVGRHHSVINWHSVHRHSQVICTDEVAFVMVVVSEMRVVSEKRVVSEMSVASKMLLRTVGEMLLRRVVGEEMVFRGC